jgi:CopG-like RHH_1 or ribbon-helix-helix domain, RHH_5
MNPTAINPLTLPSLPLANRSALPPCPAVYFVLEGDRVLYIGRSVNLQQRWMTHRRYKQLKAISNVRIAWLECNDPNLLPEIEVALIKYFQPSLNGKLIPQSPQDIARIVFHAPDEIKEKLERLAAKRLRSVSNLVRLIVEEEIAKAEKRGELPESVTEPQTSNRVTQGN